MVEGRVGSVNYVHCDYCDAHTPALSDRVDWIVLSIRCMVLKGIKPEEEQSIKEATMDFCPQCAYRIEDLPMTVKRGMAEGFPRP